MAFSSGLSVPTMSTHHPAPSRQGKVNREMESEAKATLLPTGCESKKETGSLFRFLRPPSAHSVFREQGVKRDAAAPFQGWDTNSPRLLLHGCECRHGDKEAAASIFRHFNPTTV